MPESSQKVENSVGKGKIAIYEQFVLFPQCFQKTSNADMEKQGLVWERVKAILKTFFCNYINLDLHVETTLAS